MIFLFLFCIVLSASPRADMKQIMDRTSQCSSSLERITQSKGFLLKVQRTGTLKERLTASTILKYHYPDTSIMPVVDVLFSQNEDSSSEMPTQIAVDACFLLNAYPDRQVATLVSQNINRPFWLNPCLSLLVEYSLQDPELWSVLVGEMTSFPNDHDIKNQLARKGSDAVVPLFQKLRSSKTTEEVDMLSSIVWGLIPPKIPSQLLQELHEAQRLGPRRTGGIHLQKELGVSFHKAMDSLSKRIQAPPDSRVYTQKSQYDLGKGLLKSLCR